MIFQATPDFIVGGWVVPAGRKSHADARNSLDHNHVADEWIGVGIWSEFAGNIMSAAPILAGVIGKPLLVVTHDAV